MKRLLWPAHQESPLLGKPGHGCAGTAPSLCWSLRPELTGPGLLDTLGMLQPETPSLIKKGLLVGASVMPFLTFPVPKHRKTQKRPRSGLLSSQKPVR